MDNLQTSVTDKDPYLLDQIRESYGRVTYSHKTQEKQADICLHKYRSQQRMLVCLTAISSGTFLAAIIGVVANPAVSSLVTSFIAVLVTAMSLGAGTFRFSEQSDAHRGVATQLWDVREAYVSLISDLMSGSASPTDARARRDGLQEATRVIYADAPRTDLKAYEMARESLKGNEEMTFSSDEIDLLLPVKFRTSKPTESK